MGLKVRVRRAMMEAALRVVSEATTREIVAGMRSNKRGRRAWHAIADGAGVTAERLRAGASFRSATRAGVGVVAVSYLTQRFGYGKHTASGGNGRDADGRESWQ